MNFTTLLIEYNEGVALINLNRPDKLNALNATLLGELNDALSHLESEPSLRCLIITGSGPKAFAAGADIAELAECDKESGLSFAEFGQNVFNRIENFHVPVIAAVNGFALGGGCELAMACHLRYASENARFGQPEVKLGIVPGYGGTQRLTRLCGPAIAVELICSGDMISADRALSIGLVNKVFSAEQLLDACRSTASTIASMAPLAVRAALNCIRVAAYRPHHGMETEAREFAALCDTQDFGEGTGAFLEKRSPRFSAY